MKRREKRKMMCLLGRRGMILVKYKDDVESLSACLFILNHKQIEFPSYTYDTNAFLVDWTATGI